MRTWDQLPCGHQLSPVVLLLCHIISDIPCHHAHQGPMVQLGLYSVPGARCVPHARCAPTGVLTLRASCHGAHNHAPHTWNEQGAAARPGGGTSSGSKDFLEEPKLSFHLKF